MIKSGLPNWNEPAVGPDGRWSQPWYSFLTVLYQRTGSAQGVDSQVVYQVAQGASSAATAASDDAILFGSDRDISVMSQAASDPFASLALQPDRSPVVPDAAIIAYMIGGR